MVRSCHLCQVRKDPPDARAGLLKPIEASAPWDVVGIDLVGPFKATPRFNRYILTMVDYFSRWTIFVPLKESKAKDVVDAVMEHLVHKFGAPRAFLSDKGRQFSGGLFQRVLSRLQVRYSSTTGYHPQTNGRTERVHRVLNSMLATQVNRHHTDWDEYVSASAWAVNTSWSRKTGLTPFEILFGTPARVPSQVLYGSRAEVQVDAKEYNLRLLGILRDVHDRVRKTHVAYVQTMSDYYNRNRHDNHFAAGDCVKLYQPARQAYMPKRLQIRWTGPHVIIGPGPNAPNNYVVDIDGVHSVVHVGRIRPYHEAPAVDDEELPLLSFLPPAHGDDVDWGAVLDTDGPSEPIAPEGLTQGPVDDSMGTDDGINPSVQPDNLQEVGVKRPVGWDNVIPADRQLPAVAHESILTRHHVLFWTADDDGVRRWWMGQVWDRPTSKRSTLEVQPFNTRDRKKPLRSATFTLVWWDPRSNKEDWRMVKKPHLQPLIMEVDASCVVLTGIEWNTGHTLPESVLAVLEGTSADISPEALPAFVPDEPGALPPAPRAADADGDLTLPVGCSDVLDRISELPHDQATAPVAVQATVTASDLPPPAPITAANPPMDPRRSARLRGGAPPPRW